VVALALHDGQGRVLVQQRPAHKHHGGLWEFPGGKVEQGENPRAALVREVAEELGLTLAADELEPALLADDGGERGIVLMLYTAPHRGGLIEGREGQQWGWFSLADAACLPLAPMDHGFVVRLAQMALAKANMPPYVAPSNARP